MSDTTIKSVRRVFEILELFDQERKPLAAKEIAKRLNYPLMSAHALLKSMHALGYADFDAPNWTYIPSRNFPALLDWVRDFLDRETNILDFVTALNQETKETVNISRRVNENIKIIYGLESVHTVGVSVKVGTVMPVTKSLTGVVSLSHLEEADLDRFFNDLAAHDADQATGLDRVLIDGVRNELEQYGTSARNDVFIQGIGAVCLPIRTAFSNEELVIGVVGPSDRIAANEIEIRKTIKRLVSEYRIDTFYKLRNPRK